MGSTKHIIGDSHIVFHVGKELPPQGESILLVPGMQNAQGRGVYFSEEPDLQYIGGEHYQQQLDIAPIYCVPQFGAWRKAIMKKKSDKVVYHTEGRAVMMRDLHYIDTTDEQGTSRRYYYSKDISFYQEPQSKVYDELFGKIRRGELTTHEAENILREQSREEHVDESIIRQSLKESMQIGKMPVVEGLSEERKIHENVKETALHNEGYGVEGELG